MALKRVQILSPNYSSRGGAAVRLVVIHTAEGATTYQSLGNFFKSPSAGVSSHTGIDDTPNTVGEYVYRQNKAWTAANANPVAVQTELCAFAKWDSAEWARHPNMLANCAAWIAEECAKFNIPITKLSSSQAQGSGRGVCGHVDLGSWGGGHWDPGPSFPWAQVLDMARGGGAPPAPGPQPPKQEDLVAVAMGQKEGGALVVIYEDKNGDLWQTWQKKGESSWAGGKSGVSTAALSFFAKNPLKK